MGFLDSYTGDHFTVLGDGRTIFRPKGPDGPAYLIPDEQTRATYERMLKIAGVVGTALVLGVGNYVVGGRGALWHWAVPLVVLPVLHWYIARRAAEHLVPIHESSLFNAPDDDRVREYSYFRLWTLGAGALLCVIAGLALFADDQPAWLRWIGLAVALLAALTLPITVQDIRRKREERERETTAASELSQSVSVTQVRKMFKQ